MLLKSCCSCFIAFLKGPFTCLAGSMSCCYHVLDYDAEGWGPWRSISGDLLVWQTPAPAGGELRHQEGTGMESPSVFVIVMFSRLFLILY